MLRRPLPVTLFAIGFLLVAFFIYTETFQDPEDHSPEDLEAAEQSSGEQSFMSSKEVYDLIQELPSDVSEDILSGGPPPDGIPSIDQPNFVDLDEADQWLAPNEPVIWVEVEGEARAYPLQILMWHEIVNDTINGVPVTVTFCPLCNSSFSFHRELDGEILDFGTTGYLYQGALMMYDRQTESLWAHFGGEALGGPAAGEQLEVIPSSIVSWSEFQETYPDGLVLSRDTSHDRDYGENPYVGYDNADEPPFMFSGEIDGTFAPKERIVAVEIEEQAKAYLTASLAEERVINDDELAEPIVLFFTEGTASGLDTEDISAGADVGSTNAFFRDADGETLEFYEDGGEFKDRETESTWNIFGEAVAGPLEGENLTAVPLKLDTFWFAWAAYKPDTLLHDSGE
ncbi:DUF3179 domain-containing protein [Salisediminibacterium halotolerans]|uniref:DUF3179 domain-containing protein n=1 Tax=Salisediminibacterium halotolerans TaxID=517425 RepID=A0A1H9T057_9BACI|nr:DUF3179 domain-containing protein [Salisediminibacterium haloalkalitolerans]SER90404.1 Protein of unknown function [Salisediminibacterium haloalkalitolerans]